MARAAAKGGKRPQPDARRPARKSGGGRRSLSAAEQTLFFSRLRTHAKWMFVLLALVFAGGFVFFGVGSGSNSAGSLSDLFNNLFSGGSSGPTISSAQKEVDKHPESAKAWKELATAFQNKGRTEEAIGAWSTYTGFRPKDAQALSQLAALESTQADTLARQATSAQAAQQDAFAGSQFLPPSTTPLGRALAQDPVQQAAQSEASASASDISSRISSARQAALSTFRRLAKLRPNDASVQLDVAQAALAAGDAKAAIAAYQRVAELEPTQAAQIEGIIKQLRKSPSG